MMDQDLTVLLATREYPPHVYGGAGVHVTELAKVLRQQIAVKVACFDGPRPQAGVLGQVSPTGFTDAALAVLATDLAMADAASGVNLVHSHTWYANMAGRWAQLLWSIPHIVTAHSLEPLRPWKAEQLGGGYAVSCWAEAEAYHNADRIIAVSAGMRRDILRCYPAIDPAKVVVVHNGIDLDEWFALPSQQCQQIVQQHGIDPQRRTVLFVGRQTRQKGLPHFLRAAQRLPDDVQLVLCAGAPDTPQIAEEIRSLVDDLRQRRQGVILIDRMLPHRELQAICSAATLFVCPSVYEPLGIVNLEAMACGAPVLATATGGIPEVVVDQQTGWLVPIEQADDGTGRPLDPASFEAAMADKLCEALADESRLRAFGQAGRQRVEEHFTWQQVGKQTVKHYQEVVG
jgi:starch synthase